MKTNSQGEVAWVIRQNGIYHQHDLDSQQSTWMLLFPNQESYSSEKIVDTMNLGQHPFQPHIGFHFAHFQNWRWYMADLEKQFHDLVSTQSNKKNDSVLGSNRYTGGRRPKCRNRRDVGLCKHV